MKEFITILISFVLMSIADSIDDAFNNLISIDAIIVAGTFTIIDTIFKSFAEIGVYTYRVIRKDEWKYLQYNIVFGLVISVLVLIFKDLIIGIFDITTYQKNMLSSLLNLYPAYVVFGRTSNAIFEMIRLKGNLKLYRRSLLIFYICLVSLDTLAFFTTKNLNMLFVATIMAWALSIFYMLYNLKLKYKPIDKVSFKNVIKFGFPYTMERFISSIFLLIYGVLASFMGTKSYSIHTICYSVCLTLELITNAYQATLMIKVPESKNIKDQYINCMNIKKQCFMWVIIINFIMCFVYLIISHGSLSISSCLPYILFYASEVFGLYQYETYKTLCIVDGKVGIVLLGSIAGSLIRLFICFMFVKNSLALYVFGIVNCMDYYIRSIICKFVLRKLIIFDKCLETQKKPSN